MRASANSIVEQRQEVVNEYIREHGDAPVSMTTVAEWALRTRRMAAPRGNIVKMLARQLAEAAREEYYTDPQGRRVRTKHPVRQNAVVDGKEVQQRLWAGIESASPDHMRVSFQQRRRGILMDNLQLSTDAESWNDNQRKRWNAKPIQLSLDYTMDVEELRESTDYPEARPDDDEAEE
jgi:hypothetical protein